MKTIKQIFIGGLVGLGCVLGFNASAQTIVFQDNFASAAPASAWTSGNGWVQSNGVWYDAYYTGAGESWQFGGDATGLNGSPALVFSHEGTPSWSGFTVDININTWTAGQVTAEDVLNLQISFDLSLTGNYNEFGFHIYPGNSKGAETWWNTTAQRADGTYTISADGSSSLPGNREQAVNAAAIAQWLNNNNSTTLRMELAVYGWIGTGGGGASMAFSNFTVTDLTVVPEPATGFLLGVGALLLTGCAYFRRR